MSQKVTPKQVRAMQLMARGHSVQEVSRQLRLRRETLSRWKRKPEFKAHFEQLMAQQREDVRYRLQLLVDESISAVSYGMQSNYSDPKRLQVALNVLKLLGIDRVIRQNMQEN